MSQDLKCPKCQGAMVQRFIPDYSREAKYVSSWVEGQPKTSLFSHTKVPWGGGIPIAAYRCKGCGYLEFCAHHKFAAE
jgi:C4-type Zn-finger protein